MRGLSRIIAALGVMLLLSSGVVLAATTSRLRVTAEDQAGTRLQGVSVRIESPALIGGPQTGTTDAVGEVTFHLLPLGEYTVGAERTGFQPAEALVPVRLDRTASVLFQLVATAFSGEIEVAAAVPVVDLTRTDLGQVLDGQFLQRAVVGMDGRFFPGLLGQAPATVRATNPAVAGSLNDENAYLIDGINATDPATGAHGLMGTQLVGFDAIEEVSVLTANYDAEYSYATGGVINLVIKSGSNAFSGTVDARYRDQGFNESGEYYDPEDDISSRLSLAATLGGPIVRDRLWFFAAFDEFQEKNTPTGALAATEITGRSLIAKLTWAASNRHRVSAMYHSSLLETDNRWISEVVLPEATTHLDVERPRIQLELNSVLSPSLVLTVAGGVDTTDAAFTPQSGDLETPPEYDMDAPLDFTNGWYVEFSERNRDHLRGVLTAFARDLVGSHQLKLGGDYQRLSTDSVWFTPGGYQLCYFNNDYWGEYPWPDGDGDGLVDAFLYQGYPPDTIRDLLFKEARGWGVYAQDEWRPAPALTVSAGLRYDSMAHTNTVGVTVADFEKWQPRVGLAWDVGGRGRHVLRASWGRYTHPGVTNLGNQVPGVERGYAEYWGLDFMCGNPWIGICDRETARLVYGDDSELVHVDSDGEEHPFYRVGLYITPAETVDTLGVGRLRMPYQDQLLLAYEAQVYDQTSLELAYLDARYGDPIEDTCGNNTWAWGDGDSPRLDDPSTWTDESGCTGSVRANLAGLERKYTAWILKAESWARSWFHLIGSYTYSKSEGNNPNSSPYYGFGSGGFPGREYDHFPTNFLNLDGSFPEDHRHQLKLNGFVLLPYDFAIGVSAFYQSAPPLSVVTDCRSMVGGPNQGGLDELERLGIDYDQAVAYCQSSSSGTYYLEAPGRRRAGDLWQLDLELSKGFTIGRTNLRALVTVINATNEEAPVRWTNDPFSSRGWGAPRRYQQPRRYEVGFRIEF